jgi:hypothetical protein
MHVELRPIGSNKPYEENPHVNDAAADAVSASNETGCDSVN